MVKGQNFYFKGSNKNMTSLFRHIIYTKNQDIYSLRFCNQFLMISQILGSWSWDKDSDTTL